VLRHRVYSSVASEASVLPCDVIAAARRRHSNAVAWRHRGCAEKTPPPRTAAQRVFGRELFSGRLPSNAPLLNPCRATQQLVDMSHYIYILYNVRGHLITSDHQLYNVTPLKTPFRLLLCLLQSSPTRNYNHSQLFITLSHLHRLQSYTFVTTITYYTLTLADFSAMNYCLKLSQTLHLHTSTLAEILLREFTSYDCNLTTFS
jgi:hypothetical protein